MAHRLLKLLALTVALLFLGGAVITAAVAAAPSMDAGVTDSGVDRTYFNATKSGPLPRPRPRDGGALYFPASKSFGGGALPGVQEQLQQPTQQQQSPSK